MSRLNSGSHPDPKSTSNSGLRIRTPHADEMPWRRSALGSPRALVTILVTSASRCILLQTAYKRVHSVQRDHVNVEIYASVAIALTRFTQLMAPYGEYKRKFIIIVHSEAIILKWPWSLTITHLIAKL